MKRYARKLLALALVAAMPAAHAGQWAKTWGSTASESGGVLWQKDGSHVLSGTVTTTATGTDALFGRIDAGGSLLWARKIGGAKADGLGVQPLADGYLVTGTTRSFPEPGVPRNNLLWAKFDANWTPVYSYVFGRAATDEGGSFAALPDGGLLFTGSVTTYLTSTTWDSDILMMRMRPNGTVKWKTVLDHGPNEFATQAIDLPDGYLVAGMLQDPVVKTWGLLLMKIDKAGGGVLWKNLYTIDISGTFDRIAQGVGLRKLADGNFLLTGTLQQLNPLLGGSRAILLKVNGSGGILWSNTYGRSTLSVTATSVSQDTSDGSLLLSGPASVADQASPNFGNVSVLAAKIDPASGALGVQRRIGGDTEYNAGTVMRSGSALHLSGQHAASLLDAGAHPKVLYARLNPTTLKPVWAKTFGGAYREAGMAQKTSSGYQLGGTTYSFGYSTTNKGDLFAITLDATGGYSGCTWIQPFTLASSNPMLVAAPLALQVSIPELTPGTIGNATGAALSVTETTLAATDICSPIP